MSKIFLSIALGLSLVLSPSAALAVDAFPSPQVTVSDVVTGFDATVRLQGVAPGQTFQVHVISPGGQDVSVPVTAGSDGTASAMVPASVIAQAGTYRAFAASGYAKVTSETTFTVLTDRVDASKSHVVAQNALLPADGRSLATVVVSLVDTVGNPLAGRPVQLVGSRAQDVIVPLGGAHETDATGRMAFTVQTKMPGAIALRAMDLLSGTMLRDVADIFAQSEASAMGGYASPAQGGPSPFVAAVNDSDNTSAASVSTSTVVDHFSVTPSLTTMKVRDVLPLLTIKALDKNGDLVRAYTGDIKIETPNDSRATLPGFTPGHGTATFTGKDPGVVSVAWSVSFTKGGDQPIIVTDESGTVRGETMITVNGSAPVSSDHKIELQSPKDGDVTSSTEILIKGKGKGLSLRNLNVWIKDAKSSPDDITSGEPAATGDTEDDGSFSFTAEIPKNSGKDVMIDVQDESGQYDSGIVKVHLDFEAPAMDFTFDPALPAEGQDTRLLVTSEPGLADVTMKMKTQTISLTETDPGTYEVHFQAPKQGTVTFTVTAKDAAGNRKNIEGELEVTGPELPQVQNLRATPLAGGIDLQWDAIPDKTITNYRIQARTPGLSDITLDTEKPIDKEALMGLKAGHDYVITVSAKSGKQVGPPSAPITARTLGIQLTLTPTQSSLLLQWNFPDAAPLSTFILKYGTAENDYSEERELDGSMRVYTMDNLLPVTYYVELTPVAITGKVITELAVTGVGTPIAGDFRPVAGLTQSNGTAPSNELHAGAPVPESGLPGIPLWAVSSIAIAVCAYAVLRRRKMQKDMKVFMRQMQHRYHS